MAKGIVRKIDELGRITLHIGLRKTFGLCDGSILGFRIDDGKIRLSKATGNYKGFTVNLESNGRVLIPIEARRSLEFKDRQPIETYIEGEEIVLRKYGKECSICGSDHQLIEVDGKYQCVTCLHRFWDKYQDRRG